MLDNAFPALVNERGLLKMSEGARHEMEAYLTRLRCRPVFLTVTEDRAPLSARQRRWYFGQVLGRIEKHTGQDKDELHWYFKDVFLGTADERLIVLVDGNGEVIDERTLQTEKSITVLTTKSMAQYCDQIRNFAALKLSLEIPNPDPEWRAPA